MKRRIHFHSDCPYFAGCENMLVNFFQSEELTGQFEISFSYRYTELYQKGFESRVDRPLRTQPLRLPDVNDLASRFRMKPVRVAVKVLLNLLLFRYLFILWNAVILYRLFKKESIDLLHVNNGGYPGAYSCTSAVLAARWAGIRRVVYVVNNIAASYRSPLRWLDYPFDRMAARTVSAFVTGSRYAGEALGRVLRLQTSQLVNIPNGILPREVTESREEVLRRLGIGDAGRLLIGVVAVLEERKGHIYLLKALKLLKDQGFEKKMPLLVMEGEGPERSRLEEFVLGAGLTEDVLFAGKEPNVFNLMNAVDVLALPSISHEDFPNVVLEAMSLGKPVIASRFAGIPEQVENLKNGILVGPKDTAGLAAAIEKLANDGALRERLGQAGLRRFEERFKAEVSVKNYIQLYTNLLEGKKE